MRRSFSRRAFLALSGSLGALKAQEKKRPNILLILADDLGYSDLGCYGGEIDTPNLNRLASNGVRWSQFYTTARCCPSRASLLSGQYPHRVGVGHMVTDLGQPGYRGRLSDNAATIAEVLRPAGYRTFISGKWHVGTNDPTQHGFEQFYGTLISASTFWDPAQYLRLPRGSRTRSYEKDGFYGTDALTDHALDFLEDARRTPDQPWFLYLAYNSPHFPLHARRQEIAKYQERYAAGDYPNQNPGIDGLPRWTEENRNIENTELVVWYVFGHNHVPRPEDWPVMPVASIGFMLKPDGFFSRNPALDVPPPPKLHAAGQHPHKT